MSAPTNPLERICIGDAVVYASYGVGRVTEKDLDPDDRAEILTLQLSEGLSITLPIEGALQCLRVPSNETEIAEIQRTLRAEPSDMEVSWRLRIKATKAKVTAGLAVDLAEVIRDGAQRQPQVTTHGGPKRLSLAERHLYLKARRLLADEIAQSRGIDPANAEDWINAQLAHASDRAATTEA